MKRLYFIRHGLSEMNVKGLFAGSTDTPLTDTGKQGATKAGTDNRGIAIDLIIASPLSRTQETARLFAQGAGLSTDIIESNTLLTERDFGVLEDTPWSPGISYNLINDDLPEGVEPWDTMVKRARQLLDYIEKLPVDNVLLVGHGSIGRAIRSLVEPDADMHAGIPNTELVRWV